MRRLLLKNTCFLVWILFIIGCSQEKEETNKQFTLLDKNRTGIDFINQLTFRQDFNIYTYRNFFNGGGVAIGDVNNDGLVDIYFTGNLESNRLYLNNGGLHFSDVTEEAGVAGERAWSTGVSMADINGDGWLDIYVCNSGDLDGDNKQNELYINQKDGTFSEEAEAYGLADRGYSTHAAFFDYDKDGDLDVYLLNNSFQAIGSFNLRKNERPIRNEEGGDKLYRNDGDGFVDISEEAGIYGSVIGFGLGVTVGDLDLDGWQDIYVSNDFFERDYIYMNNGDGTFTENLTHQMRSISGASMGADMADINNDGYPDIFVTEMLPEPHERLKTKTTFENWDRYQYNLENDYYHQFTRNMLHLNNGNQTFSEIGRLAGVEATDWSWGALITDFDNDGLKDLFIANGIYKDLTDQDYINYISTEEMAKAVITNEGVDFKTLTDVIPSNKIPNYMYVNIDGYRFENKADEWGLDQLSHSNGSAYGDLDNDGDLDLVVNNVNEEAFVYVNNSRENQSPNSFLKIVLRGKGKNTAAIGSRIIAYDDDKLYAVEQMPIRGFQSTVDPRLHLGLGECKRLDSLIIQWPDGAISRLIDVETNQVLEIDENKIVKQSLTRGMNKSETLFKEVTEEINIDYAHVENKFVDFDRDRLIYHMLSAEGPAYCQGDLNGDGLDDFYIGGAKDQSGAVYLQRRDGSFRKKASSTFEKDKVSEDVDCVCFDADGDGDQDIYVASGGNEFPGSSTALNDRLYINAGDGEMTRSNQLLPSFQFENSSCVEAADYDGDGDMDLFVGVRAKPFLIGVPASGYLLSNDGYGKFSNQTARAAPGLIDLGMITDAIWSDYDGDDDSDLIVIGEWMDIALFENNNGQFTDISVQSGLDSTSGWWNKIFPVDIDSDGDLDYVLGNHGLNSRFKASRQRPIRMYVNDFDQNGTAEAIICINFGDKLYPLCLRHDLVMQLPTLKKKFLKYESYKDATMEDIFEPEELTNAVIHDAYILESSILINEDDGSLSLKNLPRETQYSPVFGIAADDFDEDGKIDLVLGGNFYYAKPEVGRYDASYGVFLKGDGEGDYQVISPDKSGMLLHDEVRSLGILKTREGHIMAVARNNAPMQFFQY